MKGSSPAGSGRLFLAVMLIVVCAAFARAQPPADNAVRSYATAVRLQNLESYDLAAQAWAKFLADFPNDARAGKALHYLGVCQFQNGQAEQAAATLEQVIAKYPQLEMIDATLLYLGVAQYNLAAARPDLYAAAADTLARVIEKHPKSVWLPDAMFYQAEALYHQGKKSEALPIYARLVNTYPKHRLAPDALYALGVAQEEAGQAEAAGKTYDAFLERNPQHALATEVGMRRGETLFSLGQFAPASKRFADAAATAGFALADYALLRQADSLAQMQQYSEAAAIYSTMLERYPNSAHAARAKLAGGKCHYLAGNNAEARRLLGDLATSGGEPGAEAAHWTARLLIKEGRAADALPLVEKALPQAGSFAAQLLMDQADATYEIVERRPEAIGLYASLAAAHPADPLAPQALYMAGYVALEAGRYAEAKNHADRFLAAHAGHELAADVGHVAAESRLLLGEHVEAETRFAELLKKYPEHPDAPLWTIRRALAAQLQKKHSEVASSLAAALPQFKEPAMLAEAQYLIGSSQIELQQYEPAVRALEASLAADAKWRQAAETRLALASAYRQLNNLAKAREQITRLVSESPESPLLDRAHYRLGEYSYLAGDYAAAMAAYRQIVDRWPQSPLVPHAMHELGIAQLNQKDAAGAEVTLSALIDKHPQHAIVPRARYARGMARHQLQKYAPAIEDFQAAIAAESLGTEKADARYVLGLCQMGLNQHAAAAETFRALLADVPQYPGADNALYQLAWCHKLLGNEVEATKGFEQLAKTYPKSSRAAEAEYHIADAAYAGKDYRKAAPLYYTSLQKAGRSPLAEKAGHKLAWCYYHQGDYERAKQTFHFQQANYPDGPLAADAAFMEAECLFKQDEFAEALAAYEKLGKLSSPDFQALALLHAGQAAGQLKSWEKSLSLLSKSVADYPASPYVAEALYEQGWARQNLDQTSEALALYEQVIAKTDAEAAARAQFMIGELQFAAKDHAEAVKSFFKVLYGYSYPKWQADAAYEAARCFEVLAKKTQAIKIYQELLDKFPGSDKVPLAKERLAELNKSQ